MITQQWAESFAQRWVDEWNRHDIDAVLAHYADDFEMSSPFIARFTGEASGTLKGKDAVGAYWRTAFAKFPDLRFDVIEVFVGAQSIAIHYHSVLGLRAVEAFFLNESGLVYKSSAAYTEH